MREKGKNFLSKNEKRKYPPNGVFLRDVLVYFGVLEALMGVFLKKIKIFEKNYLQFLLLYVIIRYH